jgi:serine/threonine protein kinase
LRKSPYRILRQIGVGGIGAVYLARRDGGQFDHRAAIKLVGCGLGYRNN